MNFKNGLLFLSLVLVYSNFSFAMEYYQDTDIVNNLGNPGDSKSEVLPKGNKNNNNNNNNSADLPQKTKNKNNSGKNSSFLNKIDKKYAAGFLAVVAAIAVPFIYNYYNAEDQEDSK